MWPVYKERFPDEGEIVSDTTSFRLAEALYRRPSVRQSETPENAEISEHCMHSLSVCWLGMLRFSHTMHTRTSRPVYAQPMQDTLDLDPDVIPFIDGLQTKT